MTATKDRFTNMAEEATAAGAKATEEAFWTARPSLAHLHAFARAAWLKTYARVTSGQPRSALRMLRGRRRNGTTKQKL